MLGLLGASFFTSNGLISEMVGDFLRLGVALSFEILLWIWLPKGYLLLSNLDFSKDSFLQSLLASALAGALVSLTFLDSSFIS